MGKLMRGYIWDLSATQYFPLSEYHFGLYWDGGAGLDEPDICTDGNKLWCIDTNGRTVSYLHLRLGGNGTWLNPTTIPNSSANVTATGITFDGTCLVLVMQDSSGTLNDFLMWIKRDDSGAFQEIKRATISDNKNQRYEYLCYLNRSFWVVDQTGDRFKQIGTDGEVIADHATRNANHEGIMSIDGTNLRFLVTTDTGLGSWDVFKPDGTNTRTNELNIATGSPGALTPTRGCEWIGPQWFYNAKKLNYTPPPPDIHVT